MIRRWKDRRAFKKAKRETEIVARGFVELHYLAVTAHGRHQLRVVIEDGEEMGVDPIILGMYTFFYNHAPVQDYAYFN